MKFKFFFFLSFLIIFSACSSGEYEITDDDIFRANFLFEHSVMMVELSTQKQLDDMGLDGTNLKRDELLTHIEKTELLEEAYGIDLGNKRFDKKLQILEDEMVEMMENWDYE